jgi:hypothetical protein
MSVLALGATGPLYVRRWATGLERAPGAAPQVLLGDDDDGDGGVAGEADGG